jgi:primosomal protein N' (replication factor Y)
VYIVGLAGTSTVADLKELVEILDETPLLTPALLQLTRWIAEYYLCPWGQVLKAAIPEGFRVQTEAVYTLTAKAQDNPETWPQGRAGEVLQCLARNGTQGQHELEHVLEVRIWPWLRRLEQRGLVLRQQQRLAPKTQPRLVTVIRLRLSSAEAEPATAAATALPNQAAVLALCRAASMGACSPPATLPWSPAAVKRLALRAAVDVTQVEKCGLSYHQRPCLPPPSPP